MRTIQEIKDQLFLVTVKERMLDNIKERSKIVSLCAERNAPHYTQLREYLHCTKRQVQALIKMPVIRLADTAEEIAKEKSELLNEMHQLGNTI